MTDWVWQPATVCARELRARRIGARELVTACWERIDAANPRLNALIAERREASLREADAADRRLTSGADVGPLCGVPMTLKDSIDTRDMITTWGTLGRARHLPRADAAVVKRLRGAGAILLGKTNTPELTLSFHTDNRLFGATRNPYSLDHTPGGSSGGSAALVAAGGSCFDIGSDTGGSIRLPAHNCGLAALRPTSGRVPRTGHAIGPGGPIQALTQLGPIARSVADLALVTRVICGPDGADEAIAPVAFDVDPEAALERGASCDGGAVDAHSLAGLRVGFHVDNGIVRATEEVARSVLDALRALERAGADVVECVPPGVHRTVSLYARVMLYDGGRWVRRLLEHAGTSLEESDAARLYAPELLTGQELLRCLEDWERFRVEMGSVWRKVDVLVCPVNACVAAPLARPEHPPEAYTYTMAYNLTGWPAAVVRAGSSSCGLPIGVQVVAPAWREDRCLRVARCIERTLGGFAPPPL